MKKWLWDLSFRIGFEKIDSQHKQLFSIANELLSDDNADNTQAKVKKTLQELKEYIEIHFRDEEHIMNKYNYPLLEKHRNIHNNIISDIKKTIKISHDVLELKNNLDTLLSAWIRDHILVEDLRFSEWLKINRLL
jgi:hemerythrin